MLKIKNQTFQPLQICIRSADHRSLESVVVSARGEVEIEDDLTTPMIDNLAKRGWLKIKRG